MVEKGGKSIVNGLISNFITNSVQLVNIEPNNYLAGGLEHVDYFPHHIGNNNPN